ncbi:hypothetical protein BD769DRAFT_1421065 [Suillus cothurnatus]|nr:hypothetical protein BD769DRAFT_1421065 [Suillus cothurnatus]
MHINLPLDRMLMLKYRININDTIGKYHLAHPSRKPPRQKMQLQNQSVILKRLVTLINGNQVGSFETTVMSLGVWSSCRHTTIQHFYRDQSGCRFQLIPESEAFDRSKIHDWGIGDLYVEGAENLLLCPNSGNAVQQNQHVLLSVSNINGHLMHQR